MFEVDLRPYHSGSLARVDRVVSFAAVRWRHDDPFLEGSFRAIRDALRGELDRRHFGKGPGWALVDLPIQADGDPAVTREGLRTLAYALSRMGGFAESPEERAVFGDLAAATSNLAHERDTEVEMNNATMWGAPVVERETPK